MMEQGQARRGATEFVAAVPYGHDPIDFAWLLRGEPTVEVSRIGAHRRVMLVFEEDLTPRVRALLPPYVLLEPIVGFGRGEVSGAAGRKRG